MKKPIRINENTVKAGDLVLNPRDFFDTTTDFVVRDVRKNFRYENGKKTDEVRGVTYRCLCPTTFDVVSFKVLTTEPVVNQEDIDNAPEPLHLEVPVDLAVIRIYKIEYSVIHVSITVPYVQLLDN